MRPMLACETDGKNLRYPLMASPKLDGIRCLIVDGTAMSRNFKPIPNKHIQSIIGRHALNGLDGELIVGRPGAADCFQKTTSGVMSHDGNPEFLYHVFDLHDYHGHVPFKVRLTRAASQIKHVFESKSVIVPHVLIHGEEDLLTLETEYLSQGYEGIMLRDPDGPYKFGRSTLKEGYLLKLKRFKDAEAVIVGFTEKLKNDNPATTDALGRTVHARKQALMSKTGVLGAMIVEDLKTCVQFDLGSGFTDAQRKEFWQARGTLEGKIVKYKYQPTGVIEKPRFPVFLGFRSELDL